MDVPLLARYHMGGLFLEAGPALDVPVKAVNEDGNDIKSEVNSGALSYVAGLGYRLSNGLSLGLRYEGGAASLFTSNRATVLGSGKFKASTALVVLGYSFGGSSKQHFGELGAARAEAD